MGTKEGASGIEGEHSAPGEAEVFLPSPCSTFFFLQEKVIPSVVIEPASNNEGEGDHEVPAGAESMETPGVPALPGPASEPPELAAEPSAGEDSQPLPSTPATSEASQDVPPGFLYKVLSFCLVLIGRPFIIPFL